jgi:hypothetical protein
MSIPKIEVGLEMIDDEDDEVVVDEIDRGRGTATLVTSDDDWYEMSLRELRSKLQDGEFVVVSTNTDDDE